jgi:hypothetical protein
MTIYGDGRGLVYALLGLLVFFIFGLPFVCMRTKAGITGKRYHGLVKAKAYALFYRAVLTGSWSKIYFRWDELDEKYNSSIEKNKRKLKRSKRVRRAQR